VEAEQRIDNLAGYVAGLVPEGVVRAAIATQFTSLIQPQTRLFWV
jgi:hypothetical protein